MKSNRRAFTLIEVSVVIVVIAMLAALVVPNLANAKRSREEAQFYQDVRRLAVQTRTRAITTGQTLALRWDENAGSLRVEIPSETDTNSVAPTTPDEREQQDRTGGNEVVAPEGLTSQSFLLEGADSNASDWEVRFFPDGKAIDGSITFSSALIFTVDIYGAARVVRELPESSSTTWEAGQLEQRT